MANASTLEAPSKKTLGAAEKIALEQTFDPTKKYVFQLVNENPEPERPIINMRTQRAEPHKKFRPFQNLIFTSQIVWNGGRINIRYYDGCESIFVSEQPKEKDVIDQLCKQTKPRNFLQGKLIVDGYDRMLLLYLMICSWNAESPFRTSTANQIFVATNSQKQATAASIKLDKIEEALKLAKDASVTKMRIHADYLGIVMTDYDSGNELTDDEVRIEYRKAASAEPEKFIESYGNKTLEVKYYIDKALVSGIINNKLNVNKAAWGSSNTVICDISGLKSNEAISQRLFEFSQTAEGAEFVIQLKAVSEA
jgi:hypothetical protein